MVKAQLDDRHKRDLLAASIKKNSRKYGNQRHLSQGEIKLDFEDIERTEQLMNKIQININKKLFDLRPHIVTYKMTHSEIANKARIIAKQSKIRVKELAILAQMTRLDEPDEEN